MNYLFQLIFFFQKKKKINIFNCWKNKKRFYDLERWEAMDRMKKEKKEQKLAQKKKEEDFPDIVKDEERLRFSSYFFSFF